MPRSRRQQKRIQAEFRAQRWRNLLSRQFNRCGICGNIFGSGRKTLDHVVPVAKGGCNRGNLVVAHEHCNNRKADRWPTGCELIWLMVANAKHPSREVRRRNVIPRRRSHGLLGFDTNFM